jgi:hypothetical protein
MSGDQIGRHKVSDMIAPRDHAYSELILECPGYFLPYYINGRRCKTERELGLHLFPKMILVVELPNTNNWTN